MRNYAKGARFEYQIMEKLRSMGCFVIRSAGSHSPADLVAFLPRTESLGGVLFVQCKASGRVGVEEVKSLWETAQKYAAKPLIAYKSGRKICIAEVINVFDNTDTKSILVERFFQPWNVQLDG